MICDLVDNMSISLFRRDVSAETSNGVGHDDLTLKLILKGFSSDLKYSRSTSTTMSLPGRQLG